MRILATDPVPALARKAFAPLGEIELAAGLDVDALAGAELLIMRSGRMPASLIEQLPSLRVIARTGAGIDNVDMTAASRHGVAVIYAPGVGARPVAEGTLAMMLAAAKQLGQLGALVREGRWAERYRFAGLDLLGATLGIVGLGSIGREVARLAGALGMHILAHDPAPQTGLEQELPDVQLLQLPQLMARSDVVSLHCGLNDSTRGMIDAALLAQAKPGAILVNVARGGVIESEQVLMDALDRGQLSAIALDVFWSEPPSPDSPLLHDPRVICSPHSIGLTRIWNERVFTTLAAGAAAALRGERPDHIANPDVLPLLAGSAR